MSGLHCLFPLARWSFPPFTLMKSSENIVKSPGYPNPDVNVALLTDPRSVMDTAPDGSNLNLNPTPVDDPGKTMATSPNLGGTPTSDKPRAPAVAPNPSLSDSDEAPPQPQRNRKPRKRGPKKGTFKIPTIEELFGVNSDTWTRFFAITVAGNLDNAEIYMKNSTTNLKMTLNATVERTELSLSMQKPNVTLKK